MDRGSIIALALAVAMVAGAGTAGVAMALAEQPATPNQTTPVSAETPNRTITVSGSGTESAEPDAAVVRLAVEKTAPEPNTARTALAENVSAVTERLLELNLSEDQIQTTDYRIGEERRPPMPDGEETAPSYQARQTIEVHLEDTDAVGAVIDAAVESGATDVQDVRFTLSEETRSELRNAALESAMDQAHSQAETLATAAELTITGPREITTESRISPYGYAVETAQASDGTSIDPGPVSVSAHVTVTYEASN